MNESIAKKITQIEESDEPEIEQIPFLLVERQSNRTTKLLANSGETAPIEGQSRSYRYQFKEPVFLSHIIVNVAEYKEYDRFRFDVIIGEGAEREIYASPSEGKVYADIDELCTSVSFTPPRAWFRQPQLQSVELYGFRKSDTAQFIEFASDMESVKTEAVSEIRALQASAQKVIDEAEEKRSLLDSLNGEIANAKSELSTTHSNIQKATSKLNEVIAKTGATAKQLEATEERLSNLHSDIKIETQKKDQLQNEIVSSQARLRELEANINLFPSEISGYVNQAGANNRIYLQYAVGPLFILCAMFFLLISGAVDLTTVITNRSDVNLAAIIVSRMPYVAVATAIIYACYRITKLFITEVMNNNRQRLSLTKVSIIAKDVSQAAETGLKLSDEQIYANRLKAKMVLLSEHINHLIATEPELIFPENLFSPLRPESEVGEQGSVASAPPRKRSRAKAAASSKSQT